MEGFRHTSLAFLAQQRFVTAAQPAASAAGSAQAAVAQLRREEAGKAGADATGGHWLVFVDGVFAPALSAIGALPAGARVDALSAALASAPERVEAAFGSADGGASPAALNAALATDGSCTWSAASPSRRRSTWCSSRPPPAAPATRAT